MWLVDTNIFITWIRQGQTPVRHLQPFLLAGQTVSCGIIRVEVLRGIINPRVKTELTQLFDVIPEIPLSSSTLKNASDMAWSLDRKGIVLPVTDLLIAACALQARSELITTDSHFSLIPGLVTRKELPKWEHDLS